MKLVIHNGWSKTGTTAFQNWLTLNEKKLSIAGIYYPKTGRWKEGSHHELALSLRPVKGYSSSHDSNVIFRKLLDELKQEKKNNAFHTVLLSSELFPEFYRYLNVVELLNEFFTSWELLTVVRPQISLIRSMHYQLVYDASVACKDRAYDLFNKKKQGYLYYENINRYEDRFCFDRVNVFGYDKNILPKLLNHLELTCNIDDNISTNISAPAIETEIIRRINYLDIEYAKRKDINETIHSKCKNLPQRLKNLGQPLSKKQKSIIISFYRQSNENLFSNYLPNEPTDNWF